MLGTKIPLLMFNCGHNYHANCFPKEKEPECHLCLKENFDNIIPTSKKMSKVNKEEEEKMKRAMQLKNEVTMESGALFIQKEDAAVAADGLLERRLEVFDMAMAQSGLQKSSFY
jgi:hypothetical protein